jgi:hypothetical protein
MDLKLHRPNGCCAKTGRPFVPGEIFYSALVRSGPALARIDCSAESWQGAPEQTLAWWRSSYPTAEAGGSTLAPVDVLLDVVEQLEGRSEDAALRYLLSLELVRRRVLRIVDGPGQERDGEPANGSHLLLACRRRDAEFLVQVVPPQAASAAGVQERLAALLWSGEAA